MSSAWTAALVGAAVALVVGFGTQWVVARRERGQRLADRRRDDLIAVQDAALEVRSSLAAYGPLARTLSGRGADATGDAVRRRVDDALARFDVTLTRVDDTAVRAVAQDWLSRVRFHFVSALEVPVADEQARWEAMNAVIAARLTPGASA